MSDLVQVLPVLAGVLQGGQVNGLNVPRWMIDDVLLSLGITRRNSPLPPTLLSGLEVGMYPCLMLPKARSKGNYQ